MIISNRLATNSAPARAFNGTLREQTSVKSLYCPRKIVTINYTAKQCYQIYFFK